MDVAYQGDGTTRLPSAADRGSIGSRLQLLREPIPAGDGLVALDFRQFSPSPRITTAQNAGYTSAGLIHREHATTLTRVPHR